MTQASTTRLTIQIRLEPGCLGPDGKQHIDTFCAVANRILAAIEPRRVHWVLLPRHDKQLAEQAYFLDGRPLSETQATLLLQRMGVALAPLLEQSDAVLSQLIERYQKNR